MAGGIELLVHARRKAENPKVVMVLATATLTLSVAALVVYRVADGGLL
ncbi:hypothetical protein ACIQI8_27365 [Streptomyces sp. NPDC092369]